MTSAQTSKQSMAQMPLLINTQRGRCLPRTIRGCAKASEILIPQTRDFLGERVAGNGLCEFLLLITTSQTQSKETLPCH